MLKIQKISSDKRPNIDTRFRSGLPWKLDYTLKTPGGQPTISYDIAFT
jgi:hypothetical protein